MAEPAPDGRLASSPKEPDGRLASSPKEPDGRLASSPDVPARPRGARAGLTPAIVVEEAARLADEVGLDRLTLAALAQRLGVALPSLYKHIRGLDAVLQQIAARSVVELGMVLSDAAVGRSGADALHAVAHAYRTYARQHPARSAAAQRAPDPADPAHVAAGERVVGVLYAVLRGYGLTGDDLVDATRGLRAVLHGFVTLEASGGFGLPRDVDRSFQQLITGFDQALRSWPKTSTVDSA